MNIRTLISWADTQWGQYWNIVKSANGDFSKGPVIYPQWTFDFYDNSELDCQPFDYLNGWQTNQKEWEIRKNAPRKEIPEKLLEQLNELLRDEHKPTIKVVMTCQGSFEGYAFDTPSNF